MESPGPDLTYFYWVLGFMMVANIGTIVTMIVYVIRIAFSAGELKTTVRHLVKATEKLEKDVNEAHRKIRGNDCGRD